MESPIVRGYRRGISYRNGNISKDSILKEFGFKDVIFDRTYNSKEQQNYLNYVYDSLKDLGNLLNLSSSIISLKDKNNESPNIVFGVSNKSYKNLVISKHGDVAHNWYYLLDKYLGSLKGLDGLANNVSELSDEIAVATSELLQRLKLKENSNKSENSIEPQLNAIREKLEDLLEQMPLKERATIEEVMEVEDSRERFIKELTEEKLEEMINCYESHSVNLGDLKEKLLNCFKEVETIKINRDNLPDFVETKFYTSVKKSKNSSNVELISIIFSNYIAKKLKEVNQYNNFLVRNDLNTEYVLDSDEILIFYEAIEKYLSIVIPFIIDNLGKSCVDENETIEDNEKENLENEDKELNENIDSILKEDSGKFKLTLFKKLAVDSGLKVDKSRTIKDMKCYYIDFKDSYIKYIRVSMYNNPNENNHCINIYCGPTGDSKYGYWWDKELNYEDLIKEILAIEDKNKSVDVKETTEKFKLDYFKDLCIKEGLKADRSESKILNKDKYIILFKNGYIQSVIAPIYISLEKEEKIKIKTLREEVYHIWTGSLNYETFVKKLKYIESEGNKEIKKDIRELEKERKEVKKKMEETKKEMEASKNTKNVKINNLYSDVENIKTTKDLRNVLLKYIKSKGIIFNYPANFRDLSSILSEKSEGFLNIEEDIISDNKLSGNSKTWYLNSSNKLIIQRRADRIKKVEGLIEGFAFIYLKNKKYSKVQKQMLVETLTFMTCKAFNLDVRTYCMNKNFENLVATSAESKKNYLKLTFTLFNDFIKYFV